MSFFHNYYSLIRCFQTFAPGIFEISTPESSGSILERGEWPSEAAAARIGLVPSKILTPLNASLPIASNNFFFVAADFFLISFLSLINSFCGYTFFVS